MSDANKAVMKRFVDELFVKGNVAIVDELVADGTAVVPGADEVGCALGGRSVF